jgi:hypothetical protein
MGEVPGRGWQKESPLVALLKQVSYIYIDIALEVIWEAGITGILT